MDPFLEFIFYGLGAASKKYKNTDETVVRIENLN
jgi:hypothetical protein